MFCWCGRVDNIYVWGVEYSIGALLKSTGQLPLKAHMFLMWASDVTHSDMKGAIDDDVFRTKLVPGITNTNATFLTFSAACHVPCYCTELFYNL